MNEQLRKQRPEPAQTPGLTGVPVQRRLDPERRGGQSFDDVRVRYNSQPERKAGLGPEQCMPAPALWGVIQMALPVIPQQSGCNCGYHALARALIQLDSASCGEQDDLERRLASFAIVKGYSVIGEAFDPYTLAGVGNSFCAENHISAQCVYREFKDEAELSRILTEAQTSGSVILFPYFPDTKSQDDPETYWGPGDSGGEENAHWGALEPEGGSAMLYEGNLRGSSLAAGGEETLPPLEVAPGAMFSSNQSILSEFNWNNFLSDWGLEEIKKQKQNVVAPSETNIESFADEAAFTQQVRQVMDNIDALPQGRARAANPIPRIEGASLVSRVLRYIWQIPRAIWRWIWPPALIQPVSLGGALVEVRRG